MAGSRQQRESDTTSDPRERREHARKPVLWAARLDTSLGSFDCIVLNLSLGGARLDLSAPIVPREVCLVLERYGALRAEVVWQVSDGIGIRFLGGTEEVARVLHGALPL